jgi:hypothetical protein
MEERIAVSDETTAVMSRREGANSQLDIGPMHGG